VVRVAAVERLEELKALVNASGEIQARDSVDIQAEIAGVIIELPVEEGMSVRKGQVLLKIDPFQTLSDVESSRATLSALEAEAKGQEFQIATAEANAARDRFLRDSARVELRQAETNLARTRVLQTREKKLLEADLISPDQFELTDTQLKLDQAKVEAAQAKVQQYESQLKATEAGIEYARAALQAIKERSEAARSNLRRAEDLLSKTTIGSPLDGVVVSLNVEVGERAVPGIQSNPIATLMTISDLRVIEAELQVDETDIVNVKLDDVGEVTVDALPDTPLVGTVIEIGNSPIAGSGSQEGKDFKVVLNIADPPDSLRPGMSCEADITTDVRQNVLVVPIQALTAREVEVDDEGRYVPPGVPAGPVVGKVAAADDSSNLRREELEGVFVVGEDGLAHFRPVETGILGEIDVEILEGVVEGEEVVVGPLEALRTLLEHTPVTVDRSKPFLRLGRRSLEENAAAGDGR
jgi:HlyD family secretion protein